MYIVYKRCFNKRYLEVEKPNQSLSLLRFLIHFCYLLTNLKQIYPSSVLVIENSCL